MKLWSHTAGERPNTVRVYERQQGGTLFARCWDKNKRNGKGGWAIVKLGHRDRARAKKYAKDQAAKLESGETIQVVTLADVLAEYKKHRTVRKSDAERQADNRRSEAWTRWIGGRSDPHSVSMSKWQSFRDARSSGAIDARGNPVPPKDRKPVRTRPVEYDLVWLSLVFNWASKWRLDNGSYLMRENPVRGYEIPHELNPLRPVATQDRFETIRKISDSHTMENRHDGKRTECRSYLSELLDMANGTGQRIGAICQLRYDDLRLEADQERTTRRNTLASRNRQTWF